MIFSLLMNLGLPFLVKGHSFRKKSTKILGISEANIYPYFLFRDREDTQQLPQEHPQGGANTSNLLIRRSYLYVRLYVEIKRPPYILDLQRC